MLTNLSQSIHSLRLDLKPEIPQALKDRFQALKDLYYIEDKNEWYSEIDENQLPVKGAMIVSVNLFAELCENTAYTGLQTPWLDKIARHISETGEPLTVEENRRRPIGYFTEILLAAYIDPIAASESFSKIKTLEIYNKGWGWTENYSSDIHVDCRSQLFAAVIELKLGTKEGSDFYKSVKDKYYNKDLAMWLDPGGVIVARNQLMAIYAELQFNPFAALKSYEDLKKTSFYDELLKQWNNECYGEEKRVVDSVREINDQFLSLLIEIELVKKCKLPVELNGCAFPVTRDF